MIVVKSNYIYSVTSNKGSGPPISETIYILKVNGARKIKSNTNVAMNKNSRLRTQIVSLEVPDRTVPKLKFF